MTYGYVHRRPETAPPPSVILGFSPADYSVEEDESGIDLSVVRTGSSAGACSVSYATANGIALAGIDYEAASGTLEWADGDSEPKLIPLTLLPSVYPRFDPDTAGNQATAPTLQSASIDDDAGGHISSVLMGSDATGSRYIEIAYSGGTAMDSSRFAFIEIVQNGPESDATLSFLSQFGGGPTLFSNAVSSSEFGIVPSVVQAPDSGVIGFLVDWDALLVRISLGGDFIDPETGEIGTAESVQGVPIVAGLPLRIVVGLTEPA